MSSIKCPECNLTNWSTAISCKRCGYFFQSPENFSATESVNPAEVFEEYQPHPIGDFQPPDTQTQPNWSQSNQRSQNYHQRVYQSQYQPSPKIGLAITSMVLGIIGCFFTAPVGLILGIVALVKFNRYPREYGGQGFAIAGVILNGLGVLALPVILAIAIPNFLAARRAADEANTISSLRKLSVAENSYMMEKGTNRCADLPTLAASGLIDSVLAGGEKSGYRFMIVNLPTINGGCEVTATPTNTKGIAPTGIRSFYTSSEEDWVIRAGAKNGLMADKNDLPLENNMSVRPTPFPKVAQR